jgi:hypothetical protein
MRPVTPVEEVGQRLAAPGITRIEYLGTRLDDVVPSNNARPVFVARRAD